MTVKPIAKQPAEATLPPAAASLPEESIVVDDQRNRSINNRRANGQFGRTDALDYIRSEWTVDLSDWINIPDGHEPLPKTALANTAVMIALQILTYNHRVRQACDAAAKTYTEVSALAAVCKAHFALTATLNALMVDEFVPV